MGSLRRLLKKFRPWPAVKIFLFIISFLVLIFSAYNLVFWGRIFPNISVAGVPLSDMSPEDSSRFLSENIQVPKTLKLVNQNQSFDLATKDIGLSYDFSASSNKAFNFVRTGDVATDFINRVKLLFSPVNLPLETKVDQDKLSKFVSVISGQDSQEAVSPSIKIVSGKIVVSKGSTGTEIDQNLLKTKITTKLSFGSNADVTIPINIIDNTLNTSEQEDAKARAEKYLGKKIIVNFEFNSYELKDADIINFLNPKGGFDGDKISSYSGKIAKLINRDPQNPKFSFDGGRVTEFQPALDGIVLDEKIFGEKLIDSLNQLEAGDLKNISVDATVSRTPPEVTTDKVNNLGINELVGRGTSTYYHSIPSRVHNIVLAASRINGTLVKPGDTFSFNDTLGDVSQFTGYQQAYIISEGKTILGDGGGVCQVSTTLFRAILHAGLPVLERAAHAYRVGYYEQDSPPGLDATVYGPSPDLKFKNDTPGYILIEAIANPKSYSLVFELYGTGDGRVATISKPVVSNVTPALPTVYQDDPTLPAGTLKQTDFSAAGAKVVFNYIVTRAGEQIYKKTFTSNYRPWAAVYLRGTGPAQ